MTQRRPEVVRDVVGEGLQLRRSIGHPLLQLLVEPANLLLGQLAISDVSRDRVDAVARGERPPLQPPVGAQLVAKAVREAEHRILGRQAGGGAQGRVGVLLVNEVEESAALELGDGVAEGRLPGRVEPAEVPIGVGDAQEVERVGEVALELGGLFLQRGLGRPLLGQVTHQANEAGDLIALLSQGAHRQQRRHPGPISSNEGPLPLFLQVTLGPRGEHLEARGDGLAQLLRQLRGPPRHLLGLMPGRRDARADHLGGWVPQQPLGRGVEAGDQPVGIGRDDAVGDVVEDRLLKHAQAAQGTVALLDGAHHRVEARAQPPHLVSARSGHAQGIVGTGAHPVDGLGQGRDGDDDGPLDQRQEEGRERQQGDHHRGECFEDLVGLASQLIEAHHQAQRGTLFEALRQLRDLTLEGDAVGSPGPRNWGSGQSGAVPSQELPIAQDDLRLEYLRVGPQRIEYLLSPHRVPERHRGFRADRDQLRVRSHRLLGPALQREVLVEQKGRAPHREGEEGRAPEEERQAAPNAQAHGQPPLSTPMEGEARQR